jgi:hypothetical protein
MAIAYRANASAGGGTGTNLTINKPTGTVDNDIMVAALLNDLSGTAWTLPSGWAWIKQSQANGNSNEWGSLAWKRASSEGASYVFTIASTWRTGMIASFSGAFTSGDPQDSTAAGLGQADTSVDAASITNATAASMNIVGMSDYNENTTAVGSSGYTKAGQLAGISIFYAIQAAAGASGIKAFTVTGVSSGAWTTCHGSIKEASVSVGQPVMARWQGIPGMKNTGRVSGW